MSADAISRRLRCCGTMADRHRASLQKNEHQSIWLFDSFSCKKLYLKIFA
jgi:hypothetical protein